MRARHTMMAEKICKKCGKKYYTSEPRDTCLICTFEKMNQVREIKIKTIEVILVLLYFFGFLYLFLK